MTNAECRIAEKRPVSCAATLPFFGFGNSFVIRISNQFLHRLAPGVHEVLRTTAEVVDGDFAHVNAEVVIKRREHVAELNRTLSRFAAEPVGGANHLTGLHPAAGQQSARHARPMVASRVVVDGWGAAKLAPDDEGNVLVQTALVQILDERADALVKQRQVLAQRAKIVSMMVP